MIRTVAEALHSVHAHGVIHRDLKPANILLEIQDPAKEGFGVPKISDFGLAKTLAADQNLTRSGDVLGTPSYMAPEQAEGRSDEIGIATDVYALGAVLYEMLTGRPPFGRETPLETLRQVVAESPLPLRRLQPGVPRDLETICLKCLEKEPGRRYERHRLSPTTCAVSWKANRSRPGRRA